MTSNQFEEKNPEKESANGYPTSSSVLFFIIVDKCHARVLNNWAVKAHQQA